MKPIKKEAAGKANEKPEKENFDMKRVSKGRKFRKDNNKTVDPKGIKRNDPAFYTKYSVLADNIARLAFNHRNGALLPTIVTATPINYDPIVVNQYVMVPGISDNKYSGINVSAEATYKVLNRKYRGSMSSRYQPADLGIVEFAITDFFCNLAQAERVYGLAQTALVNQLQIPRNLLYLMGYDYEEISTNLADFRANLNRLIIRAQALCLIKGTSLLDHHLFLLSNVFKDKDTNRGQYFAYTKKNFWLWDPKSLTTGSCVKLMNGSSSRRFETSGTGALNTVIGISTSGDIIHDLETQLDALLDDSDIDAICSDILAYFGNENNSPDIVRLSSLPEDYSVTAIYSEDILKQWHNSSAAGVGWHYENYDSTYDMVTSLPANLLPTGYTLGDYRHLFVYQEGGTIKFNIEYPKEDDTNTKYFVLSGDGTHLMSGATPFTLDKLLFDVDILNPTPNDVMEYSRNMFVKHAAPISGTDSGGTARTGYTNIVDTCGTVFITNRLCFNMFKPTMTYENGKYTATSAYSATLATAVPSLGSYDKAIALISRFDWAPIIFSSGSSEYQYFFGDVDNYIFITKDMLAPIHDVAILSEFHNPVADILIKDQ